MTIYIALRNEGTDCWRPVEAVHVSLNRYRIVTERPNDEDWPFSPGQIVVCEERVFSDGKLGQVAVRVA